MVPEGRVLSDRGEYGSERAPENLSPLPSPLEPALSSHSLPPQPHVLPPSPPLPTHILTPPHSAASESSQVDQPAREPAPAGSPQSAGEKTGREGGAVTSELTLGPLSPREKKPSKASEGDASVPSKTSDVLAPEVLTVPGPADVNGKAVSQSEGGRWAGCDDAAVQLESLVHAHQGNTGPDTPDVTGAETGSPGSACRGGDNSAAALADTHDELVAEEASLPLCDGAVVQRTSRLAGGDAEGGVDGLVSTLVADPRHLRLVPRQVANSCCGPLVAPGVLGSSAGNGGEESHVDAVSVQGSATQSSCAVSVQGSATQSSTPNATQSSAWWGSTGAGRLGEWVSDKKGVFKGDVVEGGGGEGFRGGGAGMEGVAPRFGGGYGSALAHGGRGAGRKGGSVGVSEGEGAVDGVGGRGRGEGDMTQGMPLTPPDVFTFSAQQGPFKGLAPRGLTPQKHVGGAGGRGERARSRSLSRNVSRPPPRANPLGAYEFHVKQHFDDDLHDLDYRLAGEYGQYMHDRDTDTVRAYLRHPLLDFPPTPLHTHSSLASYRRLGFYDDSERRDRMRQAVVVEGSPPEAHDGTEGGGAAPGGLHGLYPEMTLEPAAVAKPANHLADDLACILLLIWHACMYPPPHMACMHVSSSSYGMHACILLLIWPMTLLMSLLTCLGGTWWQGREGTCQRCGHGLSRHAAPLPQALRSSTIQATLKPSGTRRQRALRVAYGGQRQSAHSEFLPPPQEARVLKGAAEGGRCRRSRHLNQSCRPCNWHTQARRVNLTCGSRVTMTCASVSVVSTPLPRRTPRLSAPRTPQPTLLRTLLCLTAPTLEWRQLPHSAHIAPGEVSP